jgi:alpha-D-ribose 1-methylphosphonate 5-triphosphate synthase subunit PhnH
MNAPLLPGFTDPVHESQQVFRRVLEALSRPGMEQSITALPQSPAPLAAPVAAVLLTLADPDTPVWLSPALNQTAVRDWLTFHAAVAWTDSLSQAAFAVMQADDPLPALDTFALGSSEVPQASTTLLIQGLAGHADGPPLTLQGPGIKHQQALTLPASLAEGLIPLWADNNAFYPQGIDALLFDNDTPRFWGLSRTTTLSR